MNTIQSKTSLRKRLMVGFVIQMTITVFLVLALYATVYQSSKMVESQNQAMSVQELSVSLMMIAEEHMLEPSERAITQWKILTAKLRSEIQKETKTEMLPHNRNLIAQLDEVDKTMTHINSKAMSPQLVLAVRPTMVSQIYNLIALSKQRLNVSKALYEKAGDTLFWVVGMLSFLGVLIPLIFSYNLFKRVLMPIQELIKSIETLAHKEFDKEIPSSELKELNSLVDAINEMRVTLLNEMTLKSNLATEVEKTTLAEQNAKRLLKTLQDSQTKMVQMEKLSALGAMVGGVAHELNNPLMGVHNYIEYSLSKIADGRTADMLNRALEELDRVQRLITNMLIFSRSDHSAELTNLNLNDLINSVTMLMAPDFKKFGIILESDLNTEVMIHSNSDLLKQVLVNLLSNARDALKQTENPRITIRLITEDSSDNLKLSISDNGHGIKEKDIEHIFDPFFTTKPPGEGTGLGLSISRQLVNQVNSELVLEQTSTQGTTFSISLNSALS